MGADSGAFLERWHKIVATRDVEGLAAVLAEDVTVGAPPYWTKLETKEVALRLLEIIINTIDEFTYHREWINGPELALEFRGWSGCYLSVPASRRLRPLVQLRWLVPTARLWSNAQPRRRQFGQSRRIRVPHYES